jgi:hypothetical protein
MTVNDGGRETAIGAALAMISAFASVGAKVFDLTITDSNGEKVKGLQRPGRGVEAVREMIGSVLNHSERHRHNVIIRPNSTQATLIQLDDLTAEKAERIAPYAFITFQTSPRKHQAWVAVEQGAPADFRRRLIEGMEADISASGATRIAGSLNFKPDYAPTFPRVEITHTNPGNVTSMAALEQAGYHDDDLKFVRFVAPREEPKPVQRAETPSRRYGNGFKRWPSWEKCLAGAPESESRPGENRQSPADFLFARIAKQWGFSEEAIVDHLMEVSPKAQENGRAYAVKTVRRACESVDRNPYRGKSSLRHG